MLSAEALIQQVQLGLELETSFNNSICYFCILTPAIASKATTNLYFQTWRTIDGKPAAFDMPTTASAAPMAGLLTSSSLVRSEPLTRPPRSVRSTE